MSVCGPKVEELMQIANGFLSKQQLSLTPDAAALLRAKFQAMADAPDKQNGNGRAVRNMVEQAMRSQVKFEGKKIKRGKIPLFFFFEEWALLLFLKEELSKEKELYVRGSGYQMLLFALSL